MRTDAEVTAAAERTADITLRLVTAIRERDAALATVERVRVALAVDEGEVGLPLLATRAALDPEEQP